MSYNKEGYETYYARHREKVLKEKRKYYRQNKQKIFKYSKEWYKKNNKKVKRRVRARIDKDPINYMLIRAKTSAKKKGLKFTITRKDIVLPEYCPVLDIKIGFYKGKKNRDSTMSLDRIDNSKGYVPGNVEVISFRANRLKNDATRNEIVRLYHHYNNKYLMT